MEYKIKTNVYQGPLDVLLSLINKHKIDIYDIPIAKLTDEFLSYIEAHKVDLDNIMEFLRTASTLLEIKSKMLLFNGYETEEEEDPRAELVIELIEYKRVKQVAEELKELDYLSSKIFFKEPEDLSRIANREISPEYLSQAFDRLLSQALERNIDEEKPISREDYPVERAIENIKYKIKNRGSCSFYEVLGENYSISKLISHFLALLQLIKERELLAFQKYDFGEIFIEDYYEVEK